MAFREPQFGSKTASCRSACDSSHLIAISSAPCARAVSFSIRASGSTSNPTDLSRLAVKGQGGRILGIQETASTLVTDADQAPRRDLPAEATAAEQQQQDALHPKQQSNSAADSTGPGISDAKADGREAQAEPGLEGAEKDVGRPFLLFSQEELANQADREADTSEEFYEMTTKDYQALMAAAKAKAVKVRTPPPTHTHTRSHTQHNTHSTARTAHNTTQHTHTHTHTCVHTSSSQDRLDEGLQKERRLRIVTLMIF